LAESRNEDGEKGHDDDASICNVPSLGRPKIRGGASNKSKRNDLAYKFQHEDEPKKDILYLNKLWVSGGMYVRQNTLEGKKEKKPK
jgi:hypothetical protein